MKLIATAAVAALLVGSAASASSVGFTEGLRHTVADTTHIVGPDSPDTPPGFDLGSLQDYDDGGVNLHGRIVTQQDTYTFTSSKKFRIDWLFGGYALETNSPVDGNVRSDDNTISGFVARPSSAPGSLSNIFLNGVPSAINSFTTNITGGDSTIFGVQGPGQYTFIIDGLNMDDALYDIRISSVPLPAGAALLLTALGGLAVARRRAS